MQFSTEIADYLGKGMSGFRAQLCVSEVRAAVFLGLYSCRSLSRSPFTCAMQVSDGNGAIFSVSGLSLTGDVDLLSAGTCYVQ